MHFSLRRLTPLFVVLLFCPLAASAQTAFDIVHVFTKDGVQPGARLLYADDGNFYGTTMAGGSADAGTVFKMSPDGVVTRLHSFQGGPAGAVPAGALIQAADGHFYGTTRGYSDNWGKSGCGTVFRLTSAGSFATMHAFAGGDGCLASGALVQASGGNFYGTTLGGGAYNRGTIFRISPDGVFTRLYSFGGGADGSGPSGGLVQAADGLFYGTTTSDGAFGRGTVFRMTSAGVLTPLHAFQGVNQVNPSELTLATDGAMYGTTYGEFPWDDPASPGTIFRVTLDGTFTVVHQFQGPEGWNPSGRVLQASDGHFYGAATSSGAGGPARLLFRMTPQGVVTKQGTFGDPTRDGPVGGVIEGPDGTFYGVKRYAEQGLTHEGSAFRIAKDGSSYVVLHQFFFGPDGYRPQGSVVRTSDGSLYGMTRSGGLLGGGTVFRLAPSGAFTSLHSFGLDDDLLFHNGLMQATDGRVYGTTGATIFSIGAGGAYSLEHRVDPSGRISYPSVLLQGADGNFYGTTIYDIATVNFPTCGAIFRMTPARAFTVLHQFTSSVTGCSGSPLIQASDGNFYGTTINGGANGFGTIFRMTPAGGVTVMHAFAGGAGDGSRPRNAVTQGSDGYLYGTTEDGGTFDKGTAFRISLTGAFTLLHSFNGSNTLEFPWTALVEGPDRNFYGILTGLGSSSGRIFAMTPAGAVTILHTFNGNDGEIFGFDNLTWAGGGDFFGVADRGPGHAGEIFRLRVRGTVSGNVRRAVTGAPLAHARLTFEPGGLSAETDATGAYQVTLPIGSYVVTVAAAGHRPSRIVDLVVGPNAALTSDVTLVPYTPGDVDGDARADLLLYHPSSGAWTSHPSAGAAGDATLLWGAEGDTPVVADFDGDGASDVTVFRPATGHWFILQASTQFATHVTYQWGTAGDVPVAGDYDGDGRADLAVYRPSSGTWYIRRSSDGAGLGYLWGASGDVPVPGDYDGDRKIDVAVYRPATGHWFALLSSTGFTTHVTYQWGTPGDVPVASDYDGDGASDIAVYRPATGTWFILESESHFSRGDAYVWGADTDLPVPADYDGDGRTDIGVYRGSTHHWFVLQSSSGYRQFTTYEFGGADDVPVLKRQ